jgi:uracil-DNA glycosylase
LNRQDLNLDILKDKVIKCILCDLYKSRTHAVPGNGNTRDKIMMIGEAPGKNEDQNGVPFIGSAGKILDKALSEGGLDRSDVYITNVVKCRPPDNRVPTDKEIQICTTNYLKNEIRLISPKIICILGSTALKSLLGYEHMSKYRGKIVNIAPHKYFITYHPAATIYNSKLKQVFFEDIKKLGRIVKGDSNTLEDYL